MPFVNHTDFNVVKSPFESNQFVQNEEDFVVSPGPTRFIATENGLNITTENGANLITEN